MSNFGDIRTGYSRLDDRANYGLVYTCNCGWLDLGHLSPTSTNPLLGAANLWRQMNGEGPDAKIHWGYHYPPYFRHYDYPESVLTKMREDKLARFGDGKTGFRVTYRQKMKSFLGETETFLVRRNMSEKDKKSVAFSIFLLVSFRFESFQETLEGGGVANFFSELFRNKSYDSGFSTEDLVSNIIGFYVAIGALTKKEAIKACHPVSEETAKKIWGRDGPVGRRKNRTILPYLSVDTSMLTDGMCVDECVGQTRTFPDIFQAISPQRAGRNYIPLRT